MVLTAVNCVSCLQPKIMQLRVCWCSLRQCLCRSCCAPFLCGTELFTLQFEERGEPVGLKNHQTRSFQVPSRCGVLSQSLHFIFRTTVRVIVIGGSGRIRQGHHKCPNVSQVFTRYLDSLRVPTLSIAQIVLRLCRVFLFLLQIAVLRPSWCDNHLPKPNSLSLTLELSESEHGYYYTSLFRNCKPQLLHAYADYPKRL